MVTNYGERGSTTSFEMVLTWELAVLAILMGGAKIVHPLKGVCKKVLPCLERGTIL